MIIPIRYPLMIALLIYIAMTVRQIKINQHGSN